MPLFSILAKQGVCIINEKLNLCKLCGVVNGNYILLSNHKISRVSQKTDKI